MIWIDISSTAQTVTTPRNAGIPNGLWDSDLLKSLAVAAIGLIGSVIPVIVGWLKDRGTIAARMKQFDEASKAVEFWKGWYEAILPLDSGNDAVWRESARTQMLLVSKTVERLFQLDKAALFRKTRRNWPWWKRWFLIYRPPLSRAWIPRFLFYVYIFIGPVFIAFMMRNHISDLDAEIQFHTSEVTAPYDGRSSPAIPDETAKRIMVEASEHAKEEYMNTIPQKIVEYGLFCLVSGLAFRWLSLRLEVPQETSPLDPN